MTKKSKLPPLEEGLLQAMRALDNQIARRMQRSPAEREEKGVQKWEPYSDKIEEVVALVLNFVGNDAVKIDSLLVLGQAMSKSLYLLVEELGEDGLGAIKSAYCRHALEMIERDASRGGAVLSSDKSQFN